MLSQINYADFKYLVIKAGLLKATFLNFFIEMKKQNFSSKYVSDI